MLLLLAILSSVMATQWSIVQDGSSYHVQSGFQTGALATASWIDSREEDGWTRLVVEARDSSLPEDDRVHAAGYLEGYITQPLIYAAYVNFAGSGTANPLTPEMQQLVESQMNFIHSQIKANTDPAYFGRVMLVLRQWDGIVAGYQAAAPEQEQLSMSQLMAYVLQLEIGDYAAATAKKPLFLFGANGRRQPGHRHPIFMTNQGRRRLEGEHCSVLIKPSSDRSKLMAGHVTWSEYTSLLRTYKTYDFGRGRIQFSGFPALPMSGDDWFITSSNLLITETTNEIFNMSLYSYMTAQTIPYWIRVQVANEEQDAVSWHQTFARYNNGGYNNQWMVIDYSRFVPGSPIAPNTFVVGEQAPGMYHFEDQSQHLNTAGYWGSYNVPFYKSIWLWSGYEPMYEKYGNAYSHDECARAQIYRRDQAQVQTVEQLKKIQRYNKWQLDPLSLGDACRGISARCDLNSPFNHNDTMNGFAPFGAIDGKVADQDMVAQMVTHAVCGPTWTEQAIFHWSDLFSGVKCEQCPRSYQFDWTVFKN